MTKKTATLTSAPSQAARWFGYAASGWAFIFAAMSLYWLFGGTLGSESLGTFATEQAGNFGFLAFVGLTAILKILGGLLPLALVQGWGRRFPRRLVLGLVWVGGVLLSVNGAGLLIQHGLMQAGVIEMAQSLGTKEALQWHLFIWDPWWLLGGILYVLTALFCVPATTKSIL